MIEKKFDELKKLEVQGFKNIGTFNKSCPTWKAYLKKLSELKFEEYLDYVKAPLELRGLNKLELIIVKSIMLK